MYRITARTFEVAEQGHFTERYTKAIEQLGSDKLDVCLGGIYALERIAIDSQRDHPTVVEVLGAFIREHSRPATLTRHTGPDGADVIADLLSTKRPAPDVQAACTVLGRLPQRPGVSRGDLIGAHLEGMDLHDTRLEGANLLAAHLEGATLHNTRLEGADLRAAHLEGTKLAGAVGLIQAQLDRAFLDGETTLPDGVRRPPAPPLSSS